MHLIDLIFPKFCVGCGKVGSYFCSSCKKQLQPIGQSETICPMCERGAIDGKTHPRCQTRYAVDGLTSFFHYRGPMKQAIKAIKYRFQSDIIKACVQEATKVDQLFIPIIQRTQCAIVPIPLHPKRQRERGFNQAAEIGNAFAAFYKLPFEGDIIRRIKVTLPQVETKTRQARLENMRGVFFLSGKRVLEQIILVDDVFTTGSTMKEACNVLKRGGAKFVWSVTLAR